MTRRLTSQGTERVQPGNFVPGAAPYIQLRRVAAFPGVSAYDAIPWDTEDADAWGWHDPITNPTRITPTIPGRYLVTTVISTTSAADQRHMRLAKNGVVIEEQHYYQYTAQIRLTCEVDMNGTTDYLEVQGMHAGGAPGVLAEGANSGDGYSQARNHFYMRLVNPVAYNQVRDKPVVSYVTPAQFALLTPIDGDEVYLSVDATSGVIWHLRYNAGSSSPYKWECLGGSDLFATVAAAEAQTVAGTWGDITTIGPSIVIPRAGDYDVFSSVQVTQLGIWTANGSAYQQVWSGSAVALGVQEQVEPYNAGSTGVNSIQRGLLTQRMGGLAANTELRQRYYSQIANAYLHGVRFLRVRPVRIS